MRRNEQENKLSDSSGAGNPRTSRVFAETTRKERSDHVGVVVHRSISDNHPSLLGSAKRPSFKSVSSIQMWICINSSQFPLMLLLCTDIYRNVRNSCDLHNSGLTVRGRLIYTCHSERQQGHMTGQVGLAATLWTCIRGSSVRISVGISAFLSLFVEFLSRPRQMSG
jgi:hypothetical protein